MKLTIAEWSIVMTALNEQLEEQSRLLELARCEMAAEPYPSLAYECANQRCKKQFDKWASLNSVVDKMKQQEI